MSRTWKAAPVAKNREHEANESRWAPRHVLNARKCKKYENDDDYEYMDRAMEPVERARRTYG